MVSFQGILLATPMKIRSKTYPGNYYGWSDNWMIREDPVANGNKVIHFKSDPPANGVNLNSTTIGASNVCTGYGYFIQQVMPKISEKVPYNPLNMDKLRSSSKFGVLQFFAELDDTIAMFSAKFLRNLSYGSFTWGILPFVNDIKNLFETIRNVQRGLRDYAYEDELVTVVNRISGQGSMRIECTVTQHFTGSISLQGVEDILIAYDAIGFHPDISTVWDLVPLSFLVDYFIPIGDLLDKIIGGGWVRSCVFTGWKTIKVVGKHGFTYEGNQYHAHPFTFFQRDFLEEATLSGYIPDVNLNIPSFREIFNTIYLARSAFGGRKKFR
nr:MAG: maturation protein [Hangzhou steitz-like virus 8]